MSEPRDLYNLSVRIAKEKGFRVKESEEGRDGTRQIELHTGYPYVCTEKAIISQLGRINDSLSSVSKPLNKKDVLRILSPEGRFMNLGYCLAMHYASHKGNERIVIRMSPEN